MLFLKKVYSLCLIVLCLIITGCKNKEYYCDSEEHSLDDKEKMCSYAEVIPVENKCEDGYKPMAGKCELENQKNAEKVYVCREGYTYDEYSGFCKNSVDYESPLSVNYNCPDGYIQSKINITVCVTPGNEEKELLKYNITIECPDGYDLTKKSSSYIDKVGNPSLFGSQNNTPYVRRETYYNVCTKEITYQAKWRYVEE